MDNDKSIEITSDVSEFFNKLIEDINETLGEAIGSGEICISASTATAEIVELCLISLDQYQREFGKTADSILQSWKHRQGSQ